jgi:hypothetical protein
MTIHPLGGQSVQCRQTDGQHGKANGCILQFLVNTPKDMGSQHEVSNTMFVHFYVFWMKTHSKAFRFE